MANASLEVTAASSEAAVAQRSEDDTDLRPPAGQGPRCLALLNHEWELTAKAAPLFIVIMAAVLLLWGLSDKYLWQDEAQTAVLAERMLRVGRPLAYDGVNLITLDHIVLEDPATIAQHTTNPQAAVQYYANRGDFKADTTWKWQPWGQFIVEAVSLKTLGRTTLAARLPFALAGIVVILLLYQFVLTNFGRSLMASLAALLLVFNGYWILHCRQCRYYSLSTLFLMLTLMAYVRWQRGGRWGAAAFVIAVWCWFQVDYGTLWPVLLVLLVDALVAHRHTPLRPMLVAAALAATMAPFAYYFELWRRLSAPVGTWGDRFKVNLFNMNEYIVPLVALLGAIAVLGWRWRTLGAVERRIMTMVCAVMVGFLLWVPSAAPFSFLRYVIMLAPLGSLLAAWVLVRACGPWIGFAWLGAAVLVLTPWLSRPAHLVSPTPLWYRGAPVLRPDLSLMAAEVFGHRPDPNRVLVEWFKQNARPSDEILVNYEDLPLMFYLPNPIRGGVAAFRAEDDTKTPPEFVVLRGSVGFVPWAVYEREYRRYQWFQVPFLSAPDVPWGNNPDPFAQAYKPLENGPIYVARRIGSNGTLP